jgi:hypothetical protein
MTYWRTYRITSKDVRSSYTRFYLDGYVSYSGGSEKYIDTKNYYPFYNWHECNYLEIDNDQTRYNSSGYEYTNTSYVRLSGCHHGCHGHCDHGTSEALRASESRNSTLTSENTRLNNELSDKSKDIGIKTEQLNSVRKDLKATENQLTETKGKLTKTEDKLATTNKKLEDLNVSFSNLTIENNNRGELIEDLKKEVNEKKDENFGLKVKEQEKKLDEFVQELGIDREKPRKLIRAYQRLIRASSREDYNRNDKMDAEDDIEAIKDELLSSRWFKRGISLENVQKLCKRCERVAELKVGREKGQDEMYQQQKRIQHQEHQRRIQQAQEQERQNQQEQPEQQHQAQQEQPTNNN